MIAWVFSASLRLSVTRTSQALKIFHLHRTMDTSLNGLHALVCGSTQGIGRATAMELARAGARITLLARDEARLNEVLAMLDRSAGQQHTLAVADMADTSALGRTMAAVVADHGPVDIVVNNTGGPAPGPAHGSEVGSFEHAFRQHLLANQTILLAVVPGMKAKRHGRIINIISTSVKQPIPGLGVSNTIRGAVAQWAKTLAGELGPFGITVNNVLPGSTDTERIRDLVRRKAEANKIGLEAAAEAMKNEVPLKRFARPEEIAYAVVFLAGPSAAYINGINLPVDGGRTSGL